MPFTDEQTRRNRYYFKNPAYSYADAIFLYSMLRLFKPKQLVEIGSGFSSALTLDVNEKFLDDSMKITFIEPYPQILYNLFRDKDKKHTVIRSPVQLIPLDFFEGLREGDLLFIDSTHVSKIGSDVNYIYLEIFPRLKPGVLIHIHDVFPGFEYPPHWVYSGVSWNEQYLLRALLVGNQKFEILLIGNQMIENERAWFKEKMPLCLKDQGGSIWLRSK